VTKVYTVATPKNSQNYRLLESGETKRSPWSPGAASGVRVSSRIAAHCSKWTVQRYRWKTDHVTFNASCALSHMYAVDRISSRTVAVSINFEVLLNCLVCQQSSRVTHVQSADKRRRTVQIWYRTQSSTDMYSACSVSAGAFCSDGQKLG